MKYSKQIPVISNKQISSDVWQLDVQDAQIAAATLPGQFAQLKLATTLSDPLLRRPISVADADQTTGIISFIYRILGSGTMSLTTLRPGELLDIIAPLGQGFSAQARRPLLIGGGVGIAPLIYLAKTLCQTAPQVLLAGRSAADMFWQEYFRASCDKVHITTDDGSLGIKGTALAALPDLLQTGQFDRIYTCGPAPMMQAVAAEAAKFNIECEVSLERFMACGIGACLSCSCATKSGSRVKVCTDGPVFNAKEVVQWH